MPYGPTAANENALLSHSGKQSLHCKISKGRDTESCFKIITFLMIQTLLDFETPADSANR